MKDVYLCVLGLTCLCVTIQSGPLHSGSTNSRTNPGTPPGRLKRQVPTESGGIPPKEGHATLKHNTGSLPRLTRLTFSDLQPSSSSHYTANCCDIVPELCGSAGRCTLKVTDCVSFCICARSPDLPWCTDELQRLRDVLRQRGLSISGGDSDTSSTPLPSNGLQHATAIPPTVAGQSQNETAPDHQRLGLSGVFDSPEGNVMSPVQLASSLTGALVGKPAAGHDDVTEGKQVHAPPLAAVMTEAGEENSSMRHQENSSLHGFTTNKTAGFDGKEDVNSHETERHPHSYQSNSTQLILSNSNNTNTTITAAIASTPATPDSGQLFIPWLRADEGSCGMECELNGGRCLFEFNQTHTEVCVYDTKPCLMLNCVHGTCLNRNNSFSCECDEGWSGIFCSKECTLDCGEHGRCVVFQDNVICRCDANYTGVNCGELKPTPPPWTEGAKPDDVETGWRIAAGCLGATAFLLLLLLLFAYVMWRRQWLPMRKLVHCFQHYEEDDGKEYDAFVSYRSRSSDEMFVLHELYPHLERHLDFKLCMHFRDFPPGETIADNIIHAIENSRRTILVLSPAYVQSEWCRLEYQKAQHEMLKLRHKIIPIMIEDITHISPVDQNLRTILDTVTYIHWPGPEDPKRVDKFWKLLQLSMPKKKSDYTRSLSSAESCGSDRPLTAVSASCFSHVVSSMSENSGLQPQRSLSITSSLEEAAEEGEEAGKAAESGTVVTCCDSDQSSDSGCLRDRVPSSTSSSGGENPCSPPPPPLPPPSGPRDANCSLNEDVTHVTSDDHIVEIREFPGQQVKITPWLPARISTRC